MEQTLLGIINLAILLGIYGKLLSIERRMGEGDMYFKMLDKKCRLFNNGGSHAKEKT